MAILNMTPDSFYKGSRYSSKAGLREAIRRISAEGADIIDIGGESTRPGAAGVDAKEELKRIMPAYELCRKIAPGIPVSIDTSKSLVAEAMLKAGAEMVNDISGLTYDTAMAEVCAAWSAALVVMHIQSRPRTMQKSPRYPRGVVATVRSGLAESVRRAEAAGIRTILVDPGIGFGKTIGHNYELLARLDEIASLGRPVLVGLSRKSLIGKVLDKPADARLPATMALNLVALLNGASFIRVHDATEGRDTVKLWEQFDKISRKERT